MSKKGLGCLVLSLDLTIYEMKDGIITGFIFDDRIFKETGHFSDTKIIKEKKKTEISKRNHHKIPVITIEVSEKHCPKCDITKPVSDFNKSKADRTGYQSHCRECSNKQSRERKEKQPDSELKKQSEIQKKERRKKDPRNFVEPIIETKKTFEWTKERDKIICDNFGELGISGIYDKSLLPGFSLMEIRNRCRKLDLIDQYGNTK